MANKFNTTSIQKKIFNNKKIRKEIFAIVNKKIQKEKELFNNEFINHSVTKEIGAGENSSNMSNTLNGYGNLFSFLGFSFSQADTIASVSKLIQGINLKNNFKLTKNRIFLKLSVPSRTDFENITRLPWEKGRSWLFDIEQGISGIGAYLYGTFISSRSGTGIQSKYNYSNRNFIPIKYFNSMYNKFIEKISKI